MSSSHELSKDDLIAENTKLLATIEELKSEVGVQEALLEEFDQGQWHGVQLVERLSGILEDHNLSHLVTQAFRQQDKTTTKLTQQQKQDIHDNLTKFAKSAEASPHHPSSYVIGSSTPTTISDFVTVSSDGELYQGVFFDTKDFEDFFTIIVEQTKKKKYRQHAFETVRDIERNASNLVDDEGRIDAHRFYKHYVEGDEKLLAWLKAKILECDEAGIAAPVGRLSRKMRKLFEHNQTKSSRIEATSVWMEELKTMVENRYDYNDHKEDARFYRDIRRLFKEPSQILETDSLDLYDHRELIPEEFPAQ